VVLLASRSGSVAPAGVGTVAVEPPYAAGLDWGTVGWRTLEPAERVEKLRAALAWLAARDERSVDDEEEVPPK
jgi:hypothetical protein